MKRQELWQAQLTEKEEQVRQGPLVTDRGWVTSGLVLIDLHGVPTGCCEGRGCKTAQGCTLGPVCQKPGGQHGASDPISLAVPRHPSSCIGICCAQAWSCASLRALTMCLRCALSECPHMCPHCVPSLCVLTVSLGALTMCPHRVPSPCALSVHCKSSLCRHCALTCCRGSARKR